MKRGYQYGYASRMGAMYDTEGRSRKARTMVAVLRDHLDADLDSLKALNVGGSAGIIDSCLAEHFGSVTGIDIDRDAIEHARCNFQRGNLHFAVGDALNLKYPDESFDVVICSHVYEHVPDARRMMEEIFRVLVPGGLCYFAAGNRLMWNEPHYGLPLLSVLPRPLAHLYVRLAGRGDHYHELHFTYWGLRRLVRNFRLHDLTRMLTDDPERYGVDYMLPPGSGKAALARAVARYAPWLVPSYIWLLEKPADD